MGDALVTTFQCDLCIFRLLSGHDPIRGAVKDERLLCCIRRMNLDAMWAREPGTVYGNLLNLRENLRLWELVGVLLKQVLPEMGPFPNRDVLGYGVAVNMLLKSTKAGRYVHYTQLDTIRKLRSAFSNLYNASASGALGHMYVGREVRTGLITKCPTQSEWFERFALGCLKRMGQVMRSNMAMTMELLLEFLQRVESAARLAANGNG